MTDTHPHTIRIDIDRRKLLTYLRVQALLGYVGLFSFFGLILGLASVCDHLDHGSTVSATLLAPVMLTGLSAGVAVGLVCYLAIHHYPARWRSQRLQVNVEGEYLRILDGWPIKLDKKLHFRDIIDYTHFDGPLMRLCGVSGIRMGTSAGFQKDAVVIGITNALKIRDMLCEVDCLRE